jgi:hypothetical protein
VFNAAPVAWPDVTYHNLRAEGAFLVSAQRKAGKTEWIRLKSLAGEPCRLQTDLPEPLRIVAGPKETAIRRVDDGLFELGVKKGEEIVLTGAGADSPSLVVEPLPTQSDAKRWGRPEPAGNR